MIRFVNVYKGSMSVPYVSWEKARETCSPNGVTRIIIISEYLIHDITEAWLLNNKITQQ